MLLEIAQWSGCAFVGLTTVVVGVIDYAQRHR